MATIHCLDSAYHYRIMFSTLLCACINLSYVLAITIFNIQYHVHISGGSGEEITPTAT